MKDAGFDEFLDRLRSESDIVTVISDYVSLKKKGRNYWDAVRFIKRTRRLFLLIRRKDSSIVLVVKAAGTCFRS